jgi:hypothetical protein
MYWHVALTGRQVIVLAELTGEVLPEMQEDVD